MIHLQGSLARFMGRKRSRGETSHNAETLAARGRSGLKTPQEIGRREAEAEMAAERA